MIERVHMHYQFFELERRSQGGSLSVREYLTFMFAVLGIISLFYLAFGAGPAFASEVTSGTDGPTVAGFVDLYLVVLSIVVPLFGYLISRYFSHWSEEAKGGVHVALAAGVAVLYQAVNGSDLGLTTATLIAVLTATVSALAAHFGFKAADINLRLNGTKSQSA